MKDLTFWSLVVCLGLQPVSIVSAERPMSADDAKVLCDLMTGGHLDAIAARDTSHPERFVAALFYPHSELLVTSAQYGVPQALQQLLDHKKYSEVYAILQTSPDALDRVSFVDMMADGLSAGTREGADVMYEPGNKETVFAESWRKEHRLGEREYPAKYEIADALYGSMLKILIGALNAPTPSR